MNAKRNRGAAILAAILVVAIVATASAGLLYSQSLWLQESTLSADAAQSRVAARAGIAWAAAVLRQDTLTSPIDHLREPWATPLPATDVEGARIEGVIRDLQGHYNLNNLVRAGVSQPHELARYKRLLSALELPPALAQTLADWMDADAEPNGEDGAEDAYYLALANAYRTSGQPLAELNELLRVKGYTHNVVFVLRPYVSALPSPSAINVNTAPAETLMLVADRLTLADARLLAAARERSYFRDLADFRARLPQSAYPLHADGVRTTSEFFSVDAQVKRGADFVHAQAIIQRGARAWPSVLWQRYD